MVSSNEVECVSQRYVQELPTLEETIAAVNRKSGLINKKEIQIGPNIGEGAYGAIYKGKWNGKKCAIKLLGEHVANDTAGYMRHIAEILILNELSGHANVVQFYGACFDDPSSPMLIEEFVDGQNLHDYLHPKRLDFNLGSAKVYPASAFK